jgi:hypothetical protein
MLGETIASGPADGASQATSSTRGAPAASCDIASTRPCANVASPLLIAVAGAWLPVPMVQ